MVGARLQRHVSGRPARGIPGCVQRHDFRVGLAGQRVPAFADDRVVAHDDATHHGIRVSAIATARRELQRARHVRTVGGAEHRQVFFLPRSSGSSDICSRLAAVSEMRCRRLISSSNSVMSWKRR